MTTIPNPTTPLPPDHRDDLLRIVSTRFAQHMYRHPGLVWTRVQAKLEAQPATLVALAAMEDTGGEPDVVGYDPATDAYIVSDCAPESPHGRRSLCYDGDALASRKTHKPATSALAMAAAIGITLLTEAEYRALQALEPFDTKTSSWVVTPPAIRQRGGALFCDRRYDHVFVYHNGAESYYAARGFRGVLRV